MQAPIASRSAALIGTCALGLLALWLISCGGGNDTSSNSSTSSTGASSSSSGSSTTGGNTTFGTDVLMYHNDVMRTGQNLTETTLTPSNVNSSSFGLLRMLSADDPVDATPLIVSALTVNGSQRNVVYVETEHDSVYAYDGDSGALLATVSLLGANETPSDTRSCDQVEPEIGITATPVIDRSVGAHGALFVVAMSKDNDGNYHQRLHALDLVSLDDLFAPAVIAATYPGSGENSANGVQTFDPAQYKERGALLLLAGQIYTVWASHCDHEPYNGWIISYNETALTQTAVLNFTANGEEGAIWDATGLAADSNGALYALAGNGTFDTTLNATGFPGQSDYGNSAIKLSVSGSTLSVSDYFTTTSTVSESAADVDLGSGSLLILPDQVDATGHTQHLLIGGGKDGNFLLLNRDNLGKFNPNGNSVYQALNGALPGGLYSAPAYFNGSVYVADVGGTLKAFTLSQALLSASPSSQSSAQFGYPGTSPAISANGATNAIVWAVLSSTNGAAVLHAYNPENLTQEYYNSTQAANNRDAFGNGEKFITPVIANGKVFVGTPSGVAVFGLLR
ncbi:MAG: pyrrolo-quinoline quinone [Steroidobacteraceae bacterium]